MALQALFSSVYINLGLCEQNLFDRVRTKELEHHNVSRSCSLLQRIADDVVFASYVREMRLYVYMNETKDKVPQARQCLLQALRNLHNLTAFLVFEHRSALEVDQACIDALASAQPPLTEFQYPSDGTLTLRLCDLRLDAFDRLQSFTFQLENGYRTDGWVDQNYYDMQKKFFRTFVGTRRDTLRRLDIGGNLALDCADALRELPHLAELEVDCSEGVEKIETLMQSCPNLQSFGIACYEGSDEEIMAMLAHNCSTLPYLTSFRYIQPMPRYGDAIALDGLADFLKDKKSLRRLDITARYEWDGLKVLLPYFVSSKTLNILGICLHADTFREEDARHLESHLPVGLRALRVDIDIVALEVTPGLWHDLWTRRPDLRFIYIHEGPHETGHSIDVLQLAARAPRLQAIGLNDCFWEVERGSDGSVSLSAPWLMFKVTARDFDCEDWEWLMAKFPVHIDHSLGRVSERRSSRSD